VDRFHSRRDNPAVRGSFAGLADLVPFADINKFFGKNCAKPMAGV
jgi:hypothetical protein